MKWCSVVDLPPAEVREPKVKKDWRKPVVVGGRVFAGVRVAARALGVDPKTVVSWAKNGKKARYA